MQPYKDLASPSKQVHEMEVITAYKLAKATNFTIDELIQKIYDKE